MKTILYASDYSKNSVAALKYAQKLSAMVNARLVVTHVFGHPMVTEGMVTENLPKIRKQTLIKHRAKLQDFCQQHLGGQWKTMNLQIAPVEALAILDGILAIAIDWRAELIVVGAKGQSAFQDVLLGTTTKRLIMKATCPVLAIPSRTGFTAPKTIVYATDFEQEDVYAIQTFQIKNKLGSYLH